MRKQGTEVQLALASVLWTGPAPPPLKLLEFIGVTKINSKGLRDFTGWENAEVTETARIYRRHTDTCPFRNWRALLTAQGP